MCSPVICELSGADLEQLPDCAPDHRGMLWSPLSPFLDQPTLQGFIGFGSDRSTSGSGSRRSLLCVGLDRCSMSETVLDQPNCYTRPSRFDLETITRTDGTQQFCGRSAMARRRWPEDRPTASASWVSGEPPGRCSPPARQGRRGRSLPAGRGGRPASSSRLRPRPGR
jgi:hypothetical protein